MRATSRRAGGSRRCCRERGASAPRRRRRSAGWFSDRARPAPRRTRGRRSGLPARTAGRCAAHVRCRCTLASASLLLRALAARRDRELALDRAVVADEDVLVVEVDRRVAVAWHEPDDVARAMPPGEPGDLPVLVTRLLICGLRMVFHLGDAG